MVAVHVFFSYISFIWENKSALFLNSVGTPKRCDVLFFCHDADRGISLQNKPYSPLADSLRSELKALGLICATIAHPYSQLIEHNAYGYPLAINRGYFIATILHKLFRRENSLENFYITLLKRFRPSLIITIGSPVFLASAARSLNIFHIELLHGVGYCKIPWGWDKLKKVYMPQGILSLDSISSQTFSKIPSFILQVKTIPHPFFKRFLKINQKSLPAEWVYPLPNNTLFIKRILVSLTWGYAGDHGDHLEFKNILVNGLFYPVIELLVKKRKDIQWLFRFHPVQMRKKKYNYLFKYMDNFVAQYQNCEWRDASSLPFPSVASICDGNIGMNSMCCHDAAVFGVPSLILCPTVQPGGVWENCFIDLVNEGYVKKELQDLSSIENWISNVERLPQRLSNLEDDQSWIAVLKWMLKESGLEHNLQSHDA